MASQWVPRRSYQTLLDYYTLSAFLMQVVVLLESLFVVRVYCKGIDDNDGTLDGNYNSTTSAHVYRPPPDKECMAEAGQLDKFFFYAVFGVWLMFHLVIAIGCMIWLARHTSHNQRCLRLQHRQRREHPYGLLEVDGGSGTATAVAMPAQE